MRLRTIRATKDNPCALTPREWECLLLFVEGYLNKEAAGILNVSVKTVEKYRQNLNCKLKVVGTAAMIRVAIKSGYISVKHFLEMDKGENHKTLGHRLPVTPSDANKQLNAQKARELLLGV